MAFAPGFRNYVEATGSVSEVMSIGEMIRTKTVGSFGSAAKWFAGFKRNRLT